MSTIDLGAPVKSVWAGAPAGGTHAVSITRPDGSSFTAPAISGPPVSVEFVPNQAGRWFIRWASSVVMGAYSDVIDVWPTDPRFIISLDDARIALNMPGNTQASALDDLRLYIAAATPVIEDITGPIVVKTVTQHVAKGWSYAALYERPNTINSVVYDDATVVPASAYVSDIHHGLLTFYSPVSQGVTITYTTGNAMVPQNVRLATRELVRHHWQIGKQGQRPGAGGQSTAEAWTPSGFAVPRRVIELCAGSARIDGFA